MKNSITKGLILLFITLIISGCKEDPQRHLELGKWYAQKGLVEEAILEFKEVTKGWWDYALKEAETCFQMQPTKSHYELVKLIKQRARLENSNS